VPDEFLGRQYKILLAPLPNGAALPYFNQIPAAFQSLSSPPRLPDENINIVEESDDDESQSTTTYVLDPLLEIDSYGAVVEDTGIKSRRFILIDNNNRG
jgi:hypothetical protein